MITSNEDRTLEGQQRRYMSIAKVLPMRIALFICCAWCNVAYQTEIKAESWADYLKQIRLKEGITPRFYDGITDIRTVVRDGLDNENRWIAEWGTGSKGRPYTPDDYRRLDEIFSIMSSRLDRIGGMDALQDLTLHNCAKRQLLADEKLSEGTKESIDIASKLNAMNQKDLEAEQLRGKDKASTEEITVPGIVEALKKQGVSAELSMDEAIAFINKTAGKKKYNMTIDAADQMLFMIQNLMRKNNDEPEIEEPTPDMKFDRRFVGEFEELPQNWEQEVYTYLSLNRGLEPKYGHHLNDPDDDHDEPPMEVDNKS